MSIPTQSAMNHYVLCLMNGREEPLTRKQIKVAVCNSLQLTPEEQRQTTSSGVSTYESRVGWAVSNLHSVGLLEKVSKGTYLISKEGKRFLSDGGDARGVSALIATKRPAKKRKKNTGANAQVENDQSTNVSPVERLDSAIDDYNDQVAAELLDLVYAQDPKTFEDIAVKLVEVMGYGKGWTTQYSGDGGIDGIVATDVLGFDPIFIQAKRYALDGCVGRPEVQKFAGAMNDITRGVFITTARFSDSAVQFAREYKHATISLIDGKKLAELMMQFNLGVTVQRSVDLKRIDSDFFES